MADVITIFSFNGKSISGIVRGVSEKDIAEVTEIHDENGNKILQKSFPGKKEKIIDAVFSRGTVLSAASYLIVEYNGSVWRGIVIRAFAAESNRDFIHYTISAVAKP